MAFETAIAEVSCGPPHDRHAYGADGPVINSAQRCGDKIAIDVAVQDGRRVLALKRCGQAQDRERESRMGARRDRRIDEQNPLRCDHDSLCAGRTQRVSSISTGQRYSSWVQR